VVSGNVVCVKKDTGTTPTCKTQADCSFGDCTQIQGSGYCLQYCNNPDYWISGSVEAFQTQSDGSVQLVPVKDVKVCVYNDAKTPCTNTLADGTFKLKGLPEGTYYILAMTKSGYLSDLRLSYAFEEQIATILFSDEQMKAAADFVGAKYPDTANGFISFYGTKSNADGSLALLDNYSVKIEPKSGTGPIYYNTQGVLDKTLTRASTNGWGVFFNVAPATYAITFTHPTLKCGDTGSVIVAPGYISANVPAYCQ
jgi:hypothetical protein